MAVREIYNVLFERMLLEKMNVPLDVILVDLWYLDDVIVNWRDKDRQYALAGGLLRRRFVKDAAIALRVASLWMRLRDAYGFTHLAHVLDFADDVYAYAHSVNFHPRAHVLKNEL